MLIKKRLGFSVLTERPGRAASGVPKLKLKPLKKVKKKPVGKRKK